MLVLRVKGCTGVTLTSQGGGEATGNAGLELSLWLVMLV
jgi:hypothetical protein